MKTKQILLTKQKIEEKAQKQEMKSINNVIASYPTLLNFKKKLKTTFSKKLLKQKTSKEYIAREILVSIFHSLNNVVSKLERKRNRTKTNNER